MAYQPIPAKRSAAQYVYYTAPAAADLVSVVAAILPANGALTLVANSIDYPRKLQVRIVDADTSILTGTVALVGTGSSGEAVSESITMVGGTATTVTKWAYAALTSATVVAVTGQGAGDTVGIGLGAPLGLPRGTDPTLAHTLTVSKEDVNNVNEAVGTVDSTAGTVSPTSAPNAAKNFGFWYNYT